MEYWSGIMNWEIDESWKCETCGEAQSLIWGLPHALCRCCQCHTPYRMRDTDGNVTTKPIHQLKEEYIEPAKKGWQKYKKPIDEFSVVEWDILKNDKLNLKDGE